MFVINGLIVYFIRISLMRILDPEHFFTHTGRTAHLGDAQVNPERYKMDVISVTFSES